MKTWLKGGLWGVGIGVVFWLVGLIPHFGYWIFNETFVGKITLVIIYPVLWLLFGFNIIEFCIEGCAKTPLWKEIISGIIVLVYLFVIGAIIGWIIQTIKSRKKE